MGAGLPVKMINYLHGHSPWGFDDRHEQKHSNIGKDIVIIISSSWLNLNPTHIILFNSFSNSIYNTILVNKLVLVFIEVFKAVLYLDETELSNINGKFYFTFIIDAHYII